MMVPSRWFNSYFVAALGLAALLAGCQSEQHKRNKVYSTIRLHLEMNPESTGRSSAIQVDREHPVGLTIDKVPFLNETSVEKAKLVESAGGFSIQVQFDKEGGWLLEQYTSANRGRHMAIYSRFAMVADQNLNEGRWLAAPKISTALKDGVVTFTPDATREEAEKIVLGLNNFANRVDHGPVLKW
jgi:preprotein translocase subunit SecD